MLLRVCVTPSEAERIRRLAAATGLSVSAYLKARGLNFEPKSILDHEGIRSFDRAGAQLGQIAESLRALVARGDGRHQVLDMLDEIAVANKNLMEALTYVYANR